MDDKVLFVFVIHDMSLFENRCHSALRYISTQPPRTHAHTHTCTQQMHTAGLPTTLCYPNIKLFDTINIQNCASIKNQRRPCLWSCVAAAQPADRSLWLSCGFSWICSDRASQPNTLTQLYVKMSWFVSETFSFSSDSWYVLFSFQLILLKSAVITLPFKCKHYRC